MTLKERAKELKFSIPTVYLALKHEDTPARAKILASITIIYALSPIDLIPDFIPVLGYLDDIIILPLLISVTIKTIPSSIIEECKMESLSIWSEGKPQKWYYAIPFILIWIFVIYLIIHSYFLL